MKLAVFSSIALVLSLYGCASSSEGEIDAVGLGDGVALPARPGAVLVDGCVLDTWQASTLASAATRKVVQEVVLLCLVPRVDGTVGPRDPSAIAALGSLVQNLQSEGYRVHLGISFTDESGQRYDGAQTRGFLASPAWRTQLVASLGPLLGAAQGIELDLQSLPNDATGDVTALVGALSTALRPARTIGIFVPPSTTSPSDIAGGDAFSRSALAPFVDRMRIMTLDYSSAPGPTIDPGWAVDAVRFAVSSPNVDIAYPLYGTDFGPGGHRSATYTEAIGISRIHGAPIQRGPTGAPHVAYDGHDLWFDDAESTGRALAAWTPDVLPTTVGVLFYGLGAEDPSLFEKLAARMP